MITLDTARRIARAAFDEADSRDIRNITVVVADTDGGVRLALRADSQGAFGVATARAKARCALGFGVSTRQLAAAFGGNPAAVAGIDAAVGGFIPIAGAVVVADAAGTTLGAASISGGNPEADDAIVRIAVERAGLIALD